MVKASGYIRRRVVALVRELSIKRWTIKAMRDEVHKRLNVDYCERSIQGYQAKAFLPERLKELQAEDKLMERWQEGDFQKPDSKEVKYAEALFDLVNSKISSEEFQTIEV